MSECDKTILNGIKYSMSSLEKRIDDCANIEIPKELQNVTASESGKTLRVSDTGERVAELDEKSDFSGSWNDLTDRPFYEDTVREQLYSYIGDVTTQYDDTYYVADLSTPLNGLYSGLNITVVINNDGIENTYTNVPIEEQYVGGGTYLFDYLGGKDGYPFKITSNKLYVTASGHYTVYVYKNSQTIKQIPSKFIPIDPNGVHPGSTEHFATNAQIKWYVESEINTALNAIGVAEEGAY